MAESAQRRWPADAVLDALRAWAAEHGRPPRRRDWNTAGSGHPTGEAVYRHFGTWAEALLAAGLIDELPVRPPQRQGGWDKVAVIDAIVDWTNRFGEPPRVIDWNPALARHHGRHDLAELFDRERPRWPVASAVNHAFGTWNAGLQAAAQRTTQTGLKREAPRPLLAGEGEHSHAWTPEEATAALLAFAAEHGRFPAEDEWRHRDPTGTRPTSRTIMHLLGDGSWVGALDRAERAVGRPIPRTDRRHNRQRPWPQDRIVGALQTWTAQHGRPPRPSDWKTSGDRHPSSVTVRAAFGSWAQALTAAGLD